MNITEQIDLRHLRYFLAVAEDLSFTRAAARLGIAQPPLSQQIQHIEEILGFSLFERRPKVRLTEAGEVLVVEARRTLAQAKQGLEDVIRAGKGEIGKLTIGFASSTRLGPFPELIRAYKKKFPKVRLHLQELTTAEQQKALSNGTIDIGFLREPSTERNLTCETVLNEAFVVALPPEHKLTKRTRVDIVELAEEPFVYFPRDIAPMLYDRTIDVCSSAGFIPKVAQEAIDWITIVGLVEVGFGISLVPASFCKLGWGGVKYRRLNCEDLRTTVSVCFLNETLSPPANEFIKLVGEVPFG